MDVTVVICTRNRASSLRSALQSISAAVKPDCQWELIVVDNGSSDDTPDIVSSFTKSLPIRYESEPKAGLSNARNRAVSLALGDYIVWTDDDVLVERNWLIAYTRAFREWPQASIFGGKIIPTIIEPVPDWFRRSVPFIQPALAARDLGDLPSELTVDDDRLPWGANFAVRRAEQTTALYDPLLGVAPGRRRVGEETQVMKAILRNGRGRWLPDCVVKHVIGHDRQTIKYLINYYEAQGATTAFLGQDPCGPLLFNAPRWLWKSAYSKWFSFGKAWLTQPPEVWVPKLLVAAEHWGRLRYFRTSLEAVSAGRNTTVVSDGHN